VKLNGREVAKYAYDLEGRVNFQKDENGAEHATEFDANGYVTKETHKYSGGVVSITYLREFHSQGTNGDKIKSVTETITYPKWSDVKKTEYDDKGEVLKVIRNGVVLWEA
jgi:YD repeat-containing protein